MTRPNSTSSEAPSPAACHGVLVLDKPAGITSRAALDQAAAWFPPRSRIGHAGTLDPLASGVLVLLIGQATRLVEFVQDLPKTYSAVVRLGVQSDTDDTDGVCVPVAGARQPALEEIREALSAFMGQIEQIPPKYSAAHVQGRRAYKLARKQQDFELAPRLVEIRRLDIESYAYPDLRFEIDCGKGTYIRSIARDLGLKLGCGGVIAGLRRTRIGQFKVEDGVNLEADGTAVWKRLLPLPAAIVHVPTIELDGLELKRLQQGQVMALANCAVRPVLSGPTWAVLDRTGNLAVIAKFDAEQNLLMPWKVFLREG